MCECVGEAVSASGEPVTGRLRSAGKYACEVTSAATILLWDGKEKIDEALLTDAVGVVFSSGLDGESRRRITLLSRFCRMPALCVCGEDVEQLDRGGARVAILDPVQQRLYVDPDLETISCYFSARPRYGNRSPDLLLRGGWRTDTVCDGFVVGDELSEDADEDAAYDFFCEVADRNTGARLVATVPCGTDGERAKSRIRAVYRAGVWGRFSLLCTGISGTEGTERCLSLIHAAFRELDREGREFNGFMPKGITVHTPLMLLTPPRHRFFDLFCLDYPSLMRGFTGSEDGGAGAGQVIEYMKRFADGAGNARISVSAHTAVPRRLMDPGVISEIYLDARSKDGYKGWR